MRQHLSWDSRSFDTVVGKISFDAEGDNTAKFISFYKADMSANGGKGNWIFEKQQDFGTP